LRCGTNWENDLSRFLEAVQELHSVPISDYDDRVEDICRALDEETMEVGSWPAAFFPEVLNLMKDQKFLAVRTSWHLLFFVRNNWKRLTSSEAAAFKDVLIAGFDKFGDSMGPFLASELLGRFYPDKGTLTAFKKLSKTARPPARELVPRGFETLARKTQDEELRRLAIHELESLLKDDSEEIRSEAAASLKKVSRNE